jgi:hypothetical protein
MSEGKPEAKVISISGKEVKIVHSAPSAEVVERLETLLEEARQGMLVHLSYSALRAKGGRRLTSVGWVGDVTLEEQAFGALLLHGQVQKDLITRLNGESEEGA